jgi:sn-glycerol 3-phosphate transport system ATP-binding protein
MAEIQFKEITKRYPDGFEAVKSMDLEIGDGEFMILVGPSGCGKSTALRMIAGLEDITEGDLVIGGERVNDLAPRDRDIAMVFQNYALYPHKTVYENLVFGLRMRKVPKAEQRKRVEEIARILGLGDMLERRPAQLSGGQRQRVAMGRAIVREPAVFLFDEPLSNLDAKLRVQMRIEIKHLHQNIRTTSVYVTHDQVEAMTLGDRLIVMNSGRAEQVGSPLEVYERPATTFVAGFIGSPAMNLMGGVSSVGTGLRIASDDVIFPLPPSLRLDEGRPITLGIRPEHVALARDRATANLKVAFVEALGADTLVHGHLGKDATLVVRLPGTLRVSAGDVMPLSVSADHLHVFDAQSGARLN